MQASSYAHWMLDQEARALLARLARVKPFVLSAPMVLAASLLPAAQTAIERFLAKGRRELKERVEGFLSWLHGEGRQASAEDIQRRFVFLKLRFNAVLSQLELFHQVIGQRSESEQGVWLSGLDAVAADALALPEYYEAPPVICYLDRGIGGAIRRARTRMPGGGENPVAIIRIPRERMIGSGIASSLIHETGHQAAALLELVPSLEQVLRAKQQAASELQRVASVGALDLRNRVGFLVGRAGRRGVHAWADWRCQPAAAVRVPDQCRRSASNALDPSEVELRHRRRALPPSPMAKGGEALGVLLSDGRSR